MPPTGARALGRLRSGLRSLPSGGWAIACLMAWTLAGAAPADADFVAGLQSRSVLAEAEAFDAAETASDDEESATPDAGPWLEAASAGVLIPSLGASSGAAQDTALSSDEIAGALSADTQAQASAAEPPTFGTAASESFARWVFEVDTSGLHILHGRLETSTFGEGDAFASLMLEQLVIGGASIPLVDLEADVDQVVDFALELDLEAGSLYQLTLIALSVVQMDAFTPASLGRATIGFAMAEIPEPAMPALGVAALLGLFAVRRGRRLDARAGTRTLRVNAEPCAGAALESEGGEP
ncbi:MAG: hypothetical protein ACQGVK_20500 [Myxococcota bacterium]